MISSTWRQSVLWDINIMEVDNILQLLNVVQQEFHITLEETNTYTIHKAQCLKFKKRTRDSKLSVNNDPAGRYWSSGLKIYTKNSWSIVTIFESQSKLMFIFKLKEISKYFCSKAEWHQNCKKSQKQINIYKLFTPESAPKPPVGGTPRKIRHGCADRFRKPLPY